MVVNDKSYIYCDGTTNAVLNDFAERLGIPKIRVLALIVRNISYDDLIKYEDKERSERKERERR